MALTPENTQTLLQLADLQPENRRVITSALSVLSRSSEVYPDRNGHLQLMFESRTTEPSLETTLGGEPMLATKQFNRKLAFNLFQSALSISIVQDPTPLEVSDFPGSDLYRYPRIAFATGMRTQMSDNQSPYFTRIYASDLLGRDVVPEREFTVQEFEGVFYNAVAQHGLYRQMKSEVPLRAIAA